MGPIHLGLDVHRDTIAETRFRIGRRIRADHPADLGARCRTSEDDRRRQRITFALWSLPTRKFALRHSV
jgi:hypothetical protein